MLRKTRISRFAWMTAFVLFPLLLTPLTAAAQQTAADETGWQFEISPYLFLAGMSGENGIQGYVADVEMSFGDILDLLTFAAMGMFEAKKGPWLFSFDGQYIRLEDEQVKSATGPGGWVTVTADLGVKSTEQIYQASAGYRVVDNRAKLYLLGGVRYNRVDVDLDLALSTSGDLFPGAEYHLGAGESWWDPVLGVRLEAPLAEKWAFFGYADVGGFGVGSDLTYQPVAGVNWQISKVFSAKLAYRYLAQDFESDDFVFNVKTHGPVLGVGFRF